MVDRSLIMQYNETIRDKNWFHCINIWKSGGNFKPGFFKWKPTLSPFKTLKEMEDFKKVIKSYIVHFSDEMNDGGDEHYLPNIRYWEIFLEALDVPLVIYVRTIGSFWLKKETRFKYTQQ